MEKWIRLDILKKFFNRTLDQVGRSPKSILELGPGDSVNTAILGAFHDLETIYLVDAGDFASKDMAMYQRNIDVLKKEKQSLNISTQSFDSMMDSCNAKYFTNGTQSLKDIDTDSVDIIFSVAVLEHIFYDEVETLLKEMARILKPTGSMIHRIDLRDHLGGKLNNLRFSRARWESDLFRNSGFYTNRIF